MSLSLLQEYATSSEEEEPPQKRLPAPQLPSYSVSRAISREPVTVNPEKHKNRKRAFPHQAGNWATFVAINYPVSPELQDFFDVIEELFSGVQLNLIDDIHVSLTRVVVLRHHWINDFTASLKENLQNIKSFSLVLKGIKVYLNDDKSRTFVSLKVEYGEKHLNEIVDLLDKSLEEYSLPKFYSDRSFHLSFLWALGDIKDKLEGIIEQIPEDIKALSFCSLVNSCFCKTGNKYFTIPFS